MAACSGGGECPAPKLERLELKRVAVEPVAGSAPGGGSTPAPRGLWPESVQLDASGRVVLADGATIEIVAEVAP